MKEVRLTQGFVAVVDDADFAAVAQLRWRVARRGPNLYAVTGKGTYLHRFLMDAAEVDHVDGNGLNNQRSNLRSATHAQNLASQRKRAGSSRFKGVTWHRESARWRAQIAIGGRNRHLGLFYDETQAARAYDAAAISLAGAFARPNFPEA